MAANTFLELNDTPSDYGFSSNKFIRVDSTGSTLQFWDVSLSFLSDVRTTGAYTPDAGDTLIWSASAQQWRPGSSDIYVAGNGLNKNSLTFNVTAGVGGGLTANSSGVFITDIANVSGTYGNATHHPVFTINSKGQVTGVSTVESTISVAESLNASYVGNVVGTSGQITVTGGNGLNSNATLNLVATGVTAGVYGNTTHIPQITVDTYGRIQNIDLVNVTGNISASGNSNVAQYTSLAYKTIEVEGSGVQTALSADQYDDTLTFVSGGGIGLTTNAAQDKLIFTSNGRAIAANVSVSDLSDVDTTGIANGQILAWNASSGQFEPATNQGASGVTAGTYGNSLVSARITVDNYGRITNVSEQAIPQGDITSVVAGTGLEGGGTSGAVTLNLRQSGVTAGTYGNSLVIPRITVDALGRITSVSTRSVASHIQSLSWNAGTSRLTISDGNTVDLSALAGGGGSGSGTANAFSTVAVSGQTSISSSGEDTLTLVAGTGVTLETNVSAQSVTINSTGIVNQGLDFGTFTSPVGFTLDMGAF